MKPDPLTPALSRIARAVAETLELKEVFARVAEAAATILPLEAMTVLRREGPDTFALYSFAGITPDPDRRISLKAAGLRDPAAAAPRAA